MAAIRFKDHNDGRRIAYIRLIGSRLTAEYVMHGLKVRHSWIKSTTIGVVQGKKVVWVDVTRSRYKDETLESWLLDSINQMEQADLALSQASASRPLAVVGGSLPELDTPLQSELTPHVGSLEEAAQRLGFTVTVTFHPAPELLPNGSSNKS